MIPSLRKYLAGRAARGPWQVEGTLRSDFAGAVVIPALAEEAHLFATLAGLALNPPAVLQQTLVLVVVNHRADAAATDQADNQRLLGRLRTGQGPPGMALAWIDAAAPGRELPRGEGVGLARKLGLDRALERLDWSTCPWLSCLDADTLVQPDYLPALQAHFAVAGGGATLPFAHQVPADPAQAAAIEGYELFLHIHRLGLALAGSPYAFLSIGSALACRAEAYLRAGGMNRRLAGEDFYFLQQLAKTDGVAPLAGTTVHPSARLSHRTPFGTGRSIERQLREGERALLCYPAEAYRLLAAWLQRVRDDPAAPAAALQAGAAALHPELECFLERQGWARIWTQLQRHHLQPTERLAAFHRWFDGLKTLQLIHQLCAGPWPRRPSAEVLPELLDWAGRALPATPAAQLKLLRTLAGPPERLSFAVSPL